MEIPSDYLPAPSQVPPWVLTNADKDRFDLCFALTRLITGRDDPVIARQMYASDMPTGDLAGITLPEEPAD